MKRYGNIFDKIVTLDNLRLAHKNARKNKSYYSEVKMVDENLDYYLKQIQKMLVNKTFTTSNYEVFTIIDKEKEREIFKLPYFPDRIVQHAIMQQIEHVFLNHFIYDTYAALPNKGIHVALQRLDTFLKNKEEVTYCYKFDVKKFFPSVNKEILKSLIRKKFKDKDLLWLLDDIIDSCDEGLPIGNYTSQYFGNFYLSFLDHWLKEEKQVKFSGRYMDDVYILHHDKNYLHKLRLEIENYLRVNLDLKIKENWQVFPTFIRGIDFVGYRHFGDYILLRKNTALKFKRKMRKILKKCQNEKQMTHSEWCSINSYKGWLLWCNGYNLTKKYVEPLKHYAEKYYTEEVLKVEKL
ncbi:RNA-directed DNA polymerase [Lysinibacillus sp. FSL K6-0057]|uniref:RNA-directed DNA polymerase n=1 Tax=Lysinibacillus sp. FSL K6-0057 TaxID=2921411 RepID=UPI00315AC9FA